jgi:hypothetical protein
MSVMTLVDEGALLKEITTHSVSNNIRKLAILTWSVSHKIINPSIK